MEKLTKSIKKQNILPTNIKIINDYYQDKFNSLNELSDDNKPFSSKKMNKKIYRILNLDVEGFETNYVENITYCCDSLELLKNELLKAYSSLVYDFTSMYLSKLYSLDFIGELEDMIDNDRKKLLNNHNYILSIIDKWLDMYNHTLDKDDILEPLCSDLVEQISSQVDEVITNQGHVSITFKLLEDYDAFEEFGYVPNYILYLIQDLVYWMNAKCDAPVQFDDFHLINDKYSSDYPIRNCKLNNNGKGVYEVKYDRDENYVAFEFKDDSKMCKKWYEAFEQLVACNK